MARARKSTGNSVKVNFKGVESRKTPPEGDYIVEVLEATAGKSNSSGLDQISFILEIAKGEYKGTKLYFYCPLAENSLWKLHAFLTALGEQVPEDELDIDLSDLVGKQCVGVISHETYNGKKRAKMTDFDSLENYKGGDEDEKESKKDKKKDKGAKDEDAGDGKKDKKKDKKSKKDKSEDAGKKGKDKKKAPKKYDKDEVEDMDEDELAEVVKASGIDVDLDDYKKLPKKVAAVIKALEEADLLDE